MNVPKRIDLTEKQMAALLARAKRLLPKEDYKIVKGMADTITFLSRSVGKKNAHIRNFFPCYLEQLQKKPQKY